MNLILFGFKGCGKTHFGKLLAKKMHRQFLDTDDFIAEYFTKQTGRRLVPREIYLEIGETSFRSLEKTALHALEHVKNAVIALGGGTVLDPDNVAFLQKIGCLVYLATSPETLNKRLSKETPPAFLEDNNLNASFFKTYQERKPIYESIPAAKIECDTLDEAGIFAALQSLLILQDPPNGL